VPAEVLGDLGAEEGALDVGGAEVDAGPHAGVDVLAERVGEAAPGPSRAGLVAVDAEPDPVGAEEVLQRAQDRAGGAVVGRTGIRGTAA
jgi:hypothetical protein